MLYSSLEFKSYWIYAKEEMLCEQAIGRLFVSNIDPKYMYLLHLYIMWVLTKIMIYVIVFLCALTGPHADYRVQLTTGHPRNFPQGM